MCSIFGTEINAERSEKSKTHKHWVSNRNMLDICVSTRIQNTENIITIIENIHHEYTMPYMIFF